MKKIFGLILLFVLLLPLKVNAAVNFGGRDIGPHMYEIVTFEYDGQTINRIATTNNFDEALNRMYSTPHDGAAILEKKNGRAFVSAAKYGLIDFTAFSYGNNTLQIYRDKDCTKKYTYINGSTWMSSTDGAYIKTEYGGNFLVQISGVRGYVKQLSVNILPITWVASSSYYMVTDEITHLYTHDIKNPRRGSSNKIGPKPEMLEQGNYFSYDGNYFYKDRKVMLDDYRNNNYNNANNKIPYYNYYMYLSTHSKTNYSSTEMDEYIRNVVRMTKDYPGVWDSDIKTTYSRLYGMGTFLYNSQQKYGVNALITLMHSRNESGNGMSRIAVNKNNGFGLNAVDSNPYADASGYLTFESSIASFTRDWVTDKYARYDTYQYFGPQFGNKANGMNVLYASDAYWSENMASMYYEFDKSKGLQDYNYYQQGLTLGPAIAYRNSNISTPIYNYSEKGDGVLIVGEERGQDLGGNNIWYKVLPDVNLDSNYNKIKGSTYNWENYVYIHSSYVEKINKPKYGYKSPSDVIEYKDSKYTLETFAANRELTPKVAYAKTTTPFFYGANLERETGGYLQKDRPVMVYTQATDEHGKVLAYLVTSDYNEDQKHWVKAEDLVFRTSKYLKVNYVYKDVNTGTLVRTTPSWSGKNAGSVYTRTYLPVLETVVAEGQTWYKIPTQNRYGWLLSQYKDSDQDLSTNLYDYIDKNNPPVINAKDKKYYINTDYNLLTGVSAYDQEDKDITHKVKVKEDNIRKDKPGKYKVVYEVTDSANETTTKEITVEITDKTEEKEGISNLYHLKEINNKLEYKGTTFINGINHDKNKKIEYNIIYYNIKTKKETKKKAERILDNKEIPYKAIGLDDSNYEYSWIKHDINFDDLEQGDYYLYIEEIVDGFHYKKLMSNKVFNESETSFKNNKYVIIKNDFDNRESPIKFYVRDNKLSDKKTSYYYNQFNMITKFEIIDKKLHIRGNAYSYGMNLSKDMNVERKLIFENKETYKAYKYDIGSIINGDYYVVLPEEDNIVKTRAWYDATIDLKDLEKGQYQIYIATSSDTKDISELVEKTGENYDNIRYEIDGKKYSFHINITKGSEVELTVS